MQNHDPSLEQVRGALRDVLTGVAPYVEARMRARYAHWETHVSRAAGADARAALDEYALLKTILDQWRQVFASDFPPAEQSRVRNIVSTVFEARNAVTHAPHEIAGEVARRYLDACREFAAADPRLSRLDRWTTRPGWITLAV